MATPLLAAGIRDRYGVSVRTVHRMVARGELTAQRAFPGSKSPYVFDPEEVERVFSARAALKQAEVDRLLGHPHVTAA